MSLRRPASLPAIAASIAAAAALCLGGCAVGARDAAPSPTGSTVPHGYVEGAAELGEPQHRIAAIDPAGTVRLLDPVTEEVEELGNLGPVSHLDDDGRFLAATTPAGVAIVDTGVWTVDHGDHVHYYRAEPRIVGTLALEGPATIASTESAAAVLAGDRALLLDRHALGEGAIVETARIEGAAAGGFAAPLGDGAVVAMPDAVAFLGPDGTVAAEEPCTDPAGGVVTRVGIVLGCADGAVLATETDAAAALERIDYPAGTDASLRASAFDLRPGRATAAAVAGDAGLWLLDTRERSWTLVPTEVPLERAVAVDDEEGHVVAIDADGRIAVLDAEGAVIGTTEPLLAAALGDGDVPAVAVDASRAYVPVTIDDAVLEIDYADGARIARSLTVEGPLHVAETGR